MSEAPGPTVPLQTMEANRCIVSSLDCSEAGEYLKALSELHELDDEAGNSRYFVHRQGLLLAAIVAYSRAFTKSQGGENAVRKFAVDIDSVVADDRVLRDLHNLIIEKRDKAAAHSDWKYRQSERVEMERVSGVLRKNSVVNYQSGMDIAAFQRLAKLMEDHFRFAGYQRDIGHVKPSDGAFYQANGAGAFVLRTPALLIGASADWRKAGSEFCQKRVVW